MTTYKDISDSVDEKIKGFSRYKIGKTGQPLKDRYEEEYQEDYQDYEAIWSSSNEAFIDKLEEYLIKRFIDYPGCDNEQVGGGGMSSSNVYIVYIVFNYK